MAGGDECNPCQACPVSVRAILRFYKMTTRSDQAKESNASPHAAVISTPAAMRRISHMRRGSRLGAAVSGASGCAVVVCVVG